MKEYFKKLFKLLWNKTVLGYILGCLTAAAGISLKPEVINQLICLFGHLDGCN